MPSLSPQWLRLKAVYAGAAERTGAARTAFLDSACAGDPALRAEVEALLAVEKQAEHALEGLAARLAPARVALADAPALRIGAYRLVRPLGQGGMGTVFLAERDDGQYAQRVAVKLLRPGAAPAEALARFRAERQTLARLNHPHIAHLLDGGHTAPAPGAPDGVPFLVMELVEGAPITHYCDAHALTVEARIRLFLQVCEAVAYAHQHLVVHRDLKPSNILVTPAGVPKLLDFGIARLLDGDGGDLTLSGMHPMTPAYAAPEQVRGDAITTATDVYALGVVLYELLTGVRPYAVEGRSAAEVERAVTEAEAARPSTTFGRGADGAARAGQRSALPGRLARHLRGDLDAIVLTALQKSPARRYPSAGALAGDLRRHLAHEPVQARPDRVGYRARRFARRHRAGVGAAALAVLALVGGAGVALWQAAIARAEAQKARATLSFLQTTLYAADPVWSGPDTPVRAALDTAAAHVDRDLADAPLVAAGVHSAIGYAYNNLGLYGRAAAPHRRSAALYAGAGRRYRLERAVELLSLGVALDGAGQSGEAAAYFTTALPTVRARGTPEQLGSLLNALGSALIDLERPGEAEARLQEAIAVWRRARAPQLPLALSNLAVFYESRGRAREAVPLVEEAVRGLRQQGAAGRGRLGTLLGVLGGLYDHTGHHARAVATLDSALAVLRHTPGADHPMTVLNEASRALALRRAGRLAEALQQARAAYQHARAVLPAASPIYAHAEVIYGHTLCLAAPDSARRGAAHVEKALGDRQALLPPGHYLVAQAESLLGECLLVEGRREQAIPLLQQGYDGLRAARGAQDFRTQEAWGRLVRASE